ncbi:hypothetical protein Cabys_850 [Caldithrix abyssi DSM 13497]|uniref:Uncharacterized protein n=1 Tax=Caldithrix abyssi DSM 13497 TaxID=880073 RepID=A0A1J1C5L5_CALAY|nr:hypothetical protein Cabys_850 [Caldithrix abyssi DSM 13497]
MRLKPHKISKIILKKIIASPFQFLDFFKTTFLSFWAN